MSAFSEVGATSPDYRGLFRERSDRPYKASNGREPVLQPRSVRKIPILHRKNVCRQGFVVIKTGDA